MVDSLVGRLNPLIVVYPINRKSECSCAQVALRLYSTCSKNILEIFSQTLLRRRVTEIPLNYDALSFLEASRNLLETSIHVFLAISMKRWPVSVQ